MSMQNTPVQSEENVTTLTAQLAYFTRHQYCAQSRKDRLEDLMGRYSARKWDATKKAKMVRRLTTANDEVDRSEQAIETLMLKIAALQP